MVPNSVLSLENWKFHMAQLNQSYIFTEKTHKTPQLTEWKKLKTQNQRQTSKLHSNSAQSMFQSRRWTWKWPNKWRSLRISQNLCNKRSKKPIKGILIHHSAAFPLRNCGKFWRKTMGMSYFWRTMMLPPERGWKLSLRNPLIVSMVFFFITSLSRINQRRKNKN